MDGIKKLNGSIIKIDEYFNKPVVLMSYASWCVQNENEITKLNALAEELHDQIDFVVLFWDDHNTTRKSAKKFNKHMTVLYINDRENIFSKEVTTLKRTLGYPLAMYIDQDNKIVDISRKAPNYNIEHHSNTIVDNFNNGISALLVSASTINSSIAKND